MKTPDAMTQMLQAYDVPAILVSANYEILASNKIYSEKFGDIDFSANPKCYKVSHGYSKPCDQSGEHCPLLAAKESRHKEKVLHIHRTPNGQEHVDVEMIPIFNEEQELSYFVELLRPVPLASGSNIMQKMIGKSNAFKTMLSKAALVARTNANVLILGESGTGKELLSQSIHLSSKRKNKLMVTLECAGLSDTLIESELFGHTKGAFTGANSNKIGLVEQADGGTLFLDEIGDVPMAIQIKLLRLIETRTFRRVGSTEVRTSNFRLICATHKDLRALVASGEFRHDLYYRINVFPIFTPALRQRKDDIGLLTEHFLKSVNSEINLTITESAIEFLKERPFRGNIRELFNILQRATILAPSHRIDRELIKECIEADAIHDSEILEAKVFPSFTEMEADYFSSLLAEFDGDKERAANAAGISIRTLYRKLDQK